MFVGGRTGTPFAECRTPQGLTDSTERALSSGSRRRTPRVHAFLSPADHGLAVLGRVVEVVEVVEVVVGSTPCRSGAGQTTPDVRLRVRRSVPEIPPSCDRPPFVDDEVRRTRG